LKRWIAFAGVIGIGAWAASRRKTTEPEPVDAPEIGLADPDLAAAQDGVSVGWSSSEVRIAPVREVFDPDHWIESRVTLGRFYETDRRSNPEKIAREMIRQVATRCGEERRLDREEVDQWAAEMSRDPSLIRAAEDLLHAAGWNDEICGSPTVERKGPHGRGLDLRAVHDDNAAILARGGTPRRNIDANGRVVSESRRSWPLIWIPSLSAKRFGAVILEGADGEAVTTEGVSWPDGTSASWPPACVSARGVIHGKT